MRGELGIGFRDNLPLAMSVLAYGAVLGVLASQKGLNWTELVCMDLMVFAGSAQFVMVDMWREHPPLLEMTLAVAIINLRYLLIGATLDPLLGPLPLPSRLLRVHVVADENWACTMAACRTRGVGPDHLLGGGLCIMSFWVAGTLAGLFGGGAIADPEAWALDFAFTAVFTALAVSLWEGKKSVAPWVAAIGLAILGERLLPGKWYILLGAVGGALTAGLAPAPAPAREARP